MTSQEEEDIVHYVLAEMIPEPQRVSDLRSLLANKSAELIHYANVILEKLMSEGLARQAMPTHGHYAIALTPNGIQVARQEGGYKGYLTLRREEKAEKELVEKRTIQATLDGVRANWWAVRVSVVGLVLSTLFSIIATCQSRDTAAELDKTKAQLETLQNQITQPTTK
ncbi:MAG: hypothetical protein EOO60_02370 [Hymenobacter sp.]|nr:MAG: hypothetical protein EOO60_02370 [Hymenobacter sp.]